MPIFLTLNPEVEVETSSGVIYPSNEPKFKAFVNNKKQEVILNLVSNQKINDEQHGVELSQINKWDAINIHSINSLINKGLISISLSHEDDIVLTAIPNSIDIPINWVSDNVLYTIKSHTFINFSKDSLSLETTFPKWRVEFKNTNNTIINYLKRFDGGCFKYANMSSLFERDLFIILIMTGVIITKDEDKINEQWEFHDALFHVRSRDRFDLINRGVNYRLNNPTPSVNYLPRNKSTCLYKPSTIPIRESNEFCRVLNQRRSSHAYNNVLNIELIHTIASEAFSISTESSNDIYSYQLKKFPSAGALHELNLFCAISSEVNKRNELYFFDSKMNALTLLDVNENDVVSLLNNAKECWGERNAPRVLFIIASRYERISWKYQSMAYRLSLLNAGCALQTIALIACSYGITGCPIGNGNSELFSRLLSENEFTLTSIAEYAFG